MASQNTTGQAQINQNKIIGAQSFSRQGMAAKKVPLMTSTNQAPLEVFKHRTVRGTERRVYFDGRHLVKEYRHVDLIGDSRRPWRREHVALQRLTKQGVFTPRTLGYTRAAGRIIRFYREFIPGSHLEAIDQALLNPFTDYLAAVHRAGVITCDLSPGNLLLSQDGQLLFIDYGRARTFMFKSPLFYFYVGKELARCKRRMPFRSPTSWNDFYTRYREYSGHPAWTWPIIHHAVEWWSFRWKLTQTSQAQESTIISQARDLVSLYWIGGLVTDVLPYL